MQTHPVTFPPDRRNDPMRQAEARVFDEITASRLPASPTTNGKGTTTHPKSTSPCGSSTWAGSTSRSRAAANLWTGASGPSRPSTSA